MQAAARRLVVPGGAVTGPAWQQPLVGVQHRLVLRGAERAEKPPLVAGGVGEHRERLRRMRGDDDAVEAARDAVVGVQVDASAAPGDRADGRPEVKLRPDAVEHRPHVRAAAAHNGAPAVPAQPQHPVVAEEADPV